MRDRAESVGGVMTVASVRDEGTTVRVEVGV
jgi:signal transduction histidine kinase